MSRVVRLLLLAIWKASYSVSSGQPSDRWRQSWNSVTSVRSAFRRGPGRRKALHRKSRNLTPLAFIANFEFRFAQAPDRMPLAVPHHHSNVHQARLRLKRDRRLRRLAGPAITDHDGGRLQ